MKVTTQLEEARAAHTSAIEKLEEWDTKAQALPDDAAETEVTFVRNQFDASHREVQRWAETVDRLTVIGSARSKISLPTNTPATDDGGKAPAGDLQVKEPLVYERFSPHSFFADEYAAGKGSTEAQRRLERHRDQMRVEYRDLTTSATAGGEFVPPKWLMDEWVSVPRASRPLANLVRNFPLPPNANSINLPVLTSGGATAIQASENAAVQETDPVTTSTSASVVTIAGMVDLSRQLFERSEPGMDEIIFADLSRDYATKLDVQTLSGSGASGQARGIGNVTGRIAVTYTDASPTVGELYSKIADAIQQIHTNLFRSPDVILMHPRRWGWMLAALDTTNRPLFSATAPMNAMGKFERVAAENIVGQMLGLTVVLDASITTTAGASTNEDYIFVLSSQDLYLFESPPAQRVFEDIGSGTLTVRLQVYGYAAFLATRYAKAIAQISGTGLVAPTF